MGFLSWACSLLTMARAQGGDPEGARVALKAGEGAEHYRAAVFLPDRLRAEAWAATSAGRRAVGGELAVAGGPGSPATTNSGCTKWPTSPP
jgi:hypothetical protein